MTHTSQMQLRDPVDPIQPCFGLENAAQYCTDVPNERGEAPSMNEDGR